MTKGLRRFSCGGAFVFSHFLYLSIHRLTESSRLGIFVKIRSLNALHCNR